MPTTAGDGPVAGLIVGGRVGRRDGFHRDVSWYERDPFSVRRVRQRVRKALEGFARVDDAELVVSELAGNLCLHGAGRGYELSIDWGDEFAYVELIAETGPGIVPAAPPAADVDDEAGRGLWLVANVCDCHGHREHHGLAIDWAEFWAADGAAAVNARAAWLTWTAGHPRAGRDASPHRYRP